MSVRGTVCECEGRVRECEGRVCECEQRASCLHLAPCRQTSTRTAHTLLQTASAWRGVCCLNWPTLGPSSCTCFLEATTGARSRMEGEGRGEGEEEGRVRGGKR